MDNATVRVTSPTEERNPRTTSIDSVSVLEVLELINREDQQVPLAVAAALPRIAEAVDLGVEALQSGGRVHYIGAGASGRIGAVDAAELVPTYSLRPGQFVAHLAGGLPAMVTAFEGVEDDRAAGECDRAVQLHRWWRSPGPTSTTPVSGTSWPGSWPSGSPVPRSDR